MAQLGEKGLVTDHGSVTGEMRKESGDSETRRKSTAMIFTLSEPKPKNLIQVNQCTMQCMRLEHHVVPACCKSKSQTSRDQDACDVSGRRQYFYPVSVTSVIARPGFQKQRHQKEPTENSSTGHGTSKLNARLYISDRTRCRVPGHAPSRRSHIRCIHFPEAGATTCSSK
jgi:hypothetical protein